MAIIICPKCGRVQDRGSECLRCGLVFERYRGNPSQRTPDPQTPGLVRRIYRVVCWVGLAGAVLAMLLAAHESPAPPVDMTPDAAERAATKWNRFRAAASRPGQAKVLRMTEAELNGWLSSNVTMPRESKGIRVPAKAGHSESMLRDLRVQLFEDRMLAHAGFDLHGKEMSLELEGRLKAENGYMRLEADAGRLGALPLPPPALESAAALVFEAENYREKFRLPPDVVDVRVERRELVITSR